MLKKIWREKVEMTLKGLVMVAELARHSKCDRSRYFRNQYKNKTVEIEGRSFIPRCFLTSKRDIEASKKCTVLDDYLPLGYCAKFLLDVHPRQIRTRLVFQQKTGYNFLEYKRIQGCYYIKIPTELQKKIKVGVSFAVTDFQRFNDHEDVKDFFVLGDYVIVFL